MNQKNASAVGLCGHPFTGDIPGQFQGVVGVLEMPVALNVRQGLQAIVNEACRSQLDDLDRRGRAAGQADNQECIRVLSSVFLSVHLNNLPRARALHRAVLQARDCCTSSTVAASADPQANKDRLARNNAEMIDICGSGGSGLGRGIDISSDRVEWLDAQCIVRQPNAWAIADDDCLYRDQRRLHTLFALLIATRQHCQPVRQCQHFPSDADTPRR